MRALEAIDNDLDAVEEMVEDAKKRVSSLSQRRRQLLLERYKKKYGVEVGTVVINESGARAGEKVKVTVIDTSWGRDKPWLKGTPRKKDGKWGKAVRSLYNHWRVEGP